MRKIYIEEKFNFHEDDLKYIIDICEENGWDLDYDQADRLISEYMDSIGPISMLQSDREKDYKKLEPLLLEYEIEVEEPETTEEINARIRQEVREGAEWAEKRCKELDEIMQANLDSIVCSHQESKNNKKFSFFKSIFEGFKKGKTENK